MRKKLLLLAMVLLGLTGKAMADNITFSDGEYQIGKYGVFTVYSTIEENNYNGFEIHWSQPLRLPKLFLPTSCWRPTPTS